VPTGRQSTKLPAGAAPGLVVKAAGLPAEEVKTVLQAGKLGKVADTYKKVVGRDMELPAHGWTASDTQGTVDAVIKTDETDQEAEEETAEVEQVYIGY
jgi:hypothetical protein